MPIISATAGVAARGFGGIGRGPSSPYPNLYDFELLQTTQVTNGTSSIVWNSLPSTRTGYTIEYTGAVSAATTFYLQFNGDTGANYDHLRTITGTSQAAVQNGTSATVGSTGSSRQVAGRIDVYGCDNTNGNKVANYFGAAINENLVYGWGTWKNTSAVNSMTFGLSGGTFSTTGYVFLYGWKR